jgi:hypothetical protein
MKSTITNYKNSFSKFQKLASDQQNRSIGSEWKFVKTLPWVNFISSRKWHTWETDLSRKIISELSPGLTGDVGSSRGRGAETDFMLSAAMTEYVIINLKVPQQSLGPSAAAAHGSLPKFSLGAFINRPACGGILATSVAAGRILDAVRS